MIKTPPPPRPEKRNKVQKQTMVRVQSEYSANIPLTPLSVVCKTKISCIHIANSYIILHSFLNANCFSCTNIEIKKDCATLLYIRLCKLKKK